MAFSVPVFVALLSTRIYLGPHETKKYNIGAFHSQASLASPHKKRKIIRISKSESFIRPRMSLKKVLKPLKIFSYFKCKKQQNDPQPADLSIGESKNILRRMATKLYKAHQGPEYLREEKTTVPQDLHKLSKKERQQNNSIRSLSQKNKPERVRSEKTSDYAGHLKISKKDWENITRPSAKVILYPNTGNPTLKLTVDGYTARTKTTKGFQPIRSYLEYQKKYRHQYNSWMYVQAQEGYSTGRHYWEVDVKGKCDWRVGVVKESAKRNGFINLNTAAGYWTLRLQLGSLMALTQPVTKLNQAPPTKIGVCLDLEKGQVSFYDAVKRKEIYTFNAEFRKSEKIYPVFGTVETDKPLKIV